MPERSRAVGLDREGDDDRHRGGLRRPGDADRLLGIGHGDGASPCRPRPPRRRRPAARDRPRPPRRSSGFAGGSRRRAARGRRQHHRRSPASPPRRGSRREVDRLCVHRVERLGRIAERRRPSRGSTARSAYPAPARARRGARSRRRARSSAEAPPGPSAVRSRTKAAKCGSSMPSWKISVVSMPAVGQEQLVAHLRQGMPVLRHASSSSMHWDGAEHAANPGWPRKPDCGTVAASRDSTVRSTACAARRPRSVARAGRKNRTMGTVAEAARPTTKGQETRQRILDVARGGDPRQGVRRHLDRGDRRRRRDHPQRLLLPFPRQERARPRADRALHRAGPRRARRHLRRAPPSSPTTRCTRFLIGAQALRRDDGRPAERPPGLHRRHGLLPGAAVRRRGARR